MPTRLARAISASSSRLRVGTSEGGESAVDEELVLEEPKRGIACHLTMRIEPRDNIFHEGNGIAAAGVSAHTETSGSKHLSHMNSVSQTFASGLAFSTGGVSVGDIQVLYVRFAKASLKYGRKFEATAYPGHRQLTRHSRRRAMQGQRVNVAVVALLEKVEQPRQTHRRRSIGYGRADELELRIRRRSAKLGAEDADIFLQRLQGQRATHVPGAHLHVLTPQRGRVTR